MLTGTAVYGTVRTVVLEDGRGNPASYPISPVLLWSEHQIFAPNWQGKGADRMIRPFVVSDRAEKPGYV
jgi:hypothetical protein